MAALLVSAAVAVLGGCGSDVPESEGVAGTVVVDGSSTVTPLLRAVADELVAEVEPGVVVDLTTSGTTAGIERLCDGTADLAMASRPVTADERAACEEQGVDAVEVPVGLDGVTVVVPRRNDYVDCLRIDELAAVWSADSSVQAWGDVRDAWPSTALVLYAPGEGSGTAARFADVVLDGAEQRDVATSEDDEVLVQGVAASPGGLGYVPLGHARAAEDLVRPVAVDGGDGCVEPGPGTVTDGSYPLSRPLQVYVSASAYADEPPVAALVDLLLVRQQEVAEDVLLVPATPAQQSVAEGAVEQLGAGSG